MLRTALVLVLLPAAACRPVPRTDASFRMRDEALLERFAALEGRCAPRWADHPGCVAGLRELRAEEELLFDEVRGHHFADPTESNYWHRGRLKFPGRIEQALDGLER